MINKHAWKSHSIQAQWVYLIFTGKCSAYAASGHLNFLWGNHLSSAPSKKGLHVDDPNAGLWSRHVPRYSQSEPHRLMQR